MIGFAIGSMFGATIGVIALAIVLAGKNDA